MATIRSDWTASAAGHSAVLTHYCDDGILWLHWADPAGLHRQCIEGTNVSWLWVKDYAETSDAEALRFVNCENIHRE